MYDDDVRVWEGAAGGGGSRGEPRACGCVLRAEREAAPGLQGIAHGLSRGGVPALLLRPVAWLWADECALAQLRTPSSEREHVWRRRMVVRPVLR